MSATWMSEDMTPGEPEADARPTLDEQQPPTPQAERPFQDFSVVDKPENRIEYPHPDDLRGAPQEELSAGAVKCPICQHEFDPEQ